jgi:hypothetical protein
MSDARRFDKLEQKLDKMDSRLDTYNEQLKVHIAKTEYLKDYVDTVKVSQEALSDRIKPIENSHIIWSGVGKGAAWAIPLAGVVLGALWKLGLL